MVLCTHATVVAPWRRRSLESPIVTTHIPDAASRWRCGHCGNLTRFDVTRSRTVDEYWHFSLGGVPEVSEVGVKSDVVERVSCRWCGSTDRIEVVPRPDPGGDDEHPDEVGGP